MRTIHKALKIASILFYMIFEVLHGNSKLIHYVKLTIWFKCNSADLNTEACITFLLEVQRSCNF